MHSANNLATARPYHRLRLFIQDGATIYTQVRSVGRWALESSTMRDWTCRSCMYPNRHMTKPSYYRIAVTSSVLPPLRLRTTLSKDSMKTRGLASITAMHFSDFNNFLDIDRALASLPSLEYLRLDNEEICLYSLESTLRTFRVCCRGAYCPRVECYVTLHDDEAPHETREERGVHSAAIEAFLQR